MIVILFYFYVFEMFCLLFFQNFMFEFQETQDVLFDKVIEISVSCPQSQAWYTIFCLMIQI